jgi:hypothetical protein
MGLPVFHDYLNVAMFEQGASLLARVRLDSLDAAKYFINMIKEPRIEASIDFANLNGAESRWHVVDNHSDRAMVDGKMTPIEDAMNNVRMPGDWLWMDSARGWQFFFSNNFAMEDGGLLDAFLDGMGRKNGLRGRPGSHPRRRAHSRCRPALWRTHQRHADHRQQPAHLVPRH